MKSKSKTSQSLRSPPKSMKNLTVKKLFYERSALWIVSFDHSIFHTG